MKNALRTLFWNVIFWSKGHAVGFLSAMFLALGIVLFSLAFTFPAYRDVLLNLATEFVGGVLLLVAYAAVQSHVKQQQGIDYFALEYQLSRARKRIRLLTTFSYMFCDEKSIGTEVDVAQVMRCRRSLNNTARLRPHVDIEILVLDPTSEAAKARAKDRLDVDVIQCIWENLFQLYGSITKYAPEEGNRQALKVRVFNAIPRLSIIQWDDTLSISFFERDKPVSLSRRSEFTIEQPLGRFLSSSFDELWNDPKTVDLVVFLERQGKLQPGGRATQPNQLTPISADQLISSASIGIPAE